MSERKDRVTVARLQKMKREREPIAMLTAYDYPTGQLAEASGVDVVLVGDSLGMVVLGYELTVPVTLEDMVRHTRAVRRGISRPLLVADLPFLTYRLGVRDALQAAGRLMQEGGASAVKMEGGRDLAPTVKACVEAGIPVMGHIGLKPQAVHQTGYRIQGKTEQSVRELVDDAEALTEAGVFAFVLECVTEEAAQTVSEFRSSADDRHRVRPPVRRASTRLSRRRPIQCERISTILCEDVRRRRGDRSERVSGIRTRCEKSPLSTRRTRLSRKKCSLRRHKVMKVVTTIRALRRSLPDEKGAVIGLVPTMGYLHDGHLSLIETARRECDCVVVSVFVNPLQFGPREDFDTYPRDLNRDKAQAEKAGADLLFAPDTEEMYPKPPFTTVRVSNVTEGMCGASRPGHFDGVATVVTKLFHIVQPHRAYFGS